MTKVKYLKQEEIALLAEVFQLISQIEVKGMNNVKLMSMSMEGIQNIFSLLNQREVVELEEPDSEPKEE